MVCSCRLTPGHWPSSCAGVYYVWHPICLGGNHHKSTDLLQDFLQGRLLLGPRFVNARTYSIYNHGLCPGFRRLADSKGSAATKTAAQIAIVSSEVRNQIFCPLSSLFCSFGENAHYYNCDHGTNLILWPTQRNLRV